ncbi:hypothetical protein TIFTF001_024193 [Ficus carica]|uniref:Uncharacterized protein n=1 Tax=Ficus carica TaxID=3494 RepID=A0AA88DD54_FICCA|nr:hypothetical protein TIFTF001_024193 [Ficus carica]
MGFQTFCKSGKKIRFASGRRWLRGRAIHGQHREISQASVAAPLASVSASHQPSVSELNGLRLFLLPSASHPTPRSGDRRPFVAAPLPSASNPPPTS